MATKQYTFLYNTKNNKIINSFYFNGTEKKSCSLEPIENELVAAAGYDGSIYVGNVRNEDKKSEEAYKKLPGHQGEVSTVKFLNRTYLVSCSYDSSIFLWDINSEGKHISVYYDHTSEVSALDVNSKDGNIFVTGSGDTTAKIFDIREKNACVSTLKGSGSTVNCVKFVPGTASSIVAGSEDSEIRLFDMRALGELGVYKQKDEFNSISSIEFSKSGQILFATSRNKNCVYMWDIFLQSENFNKFELVFC